jgi:hypothetical protein
MPWRHTDVGAYVSLDEIDEGVWKVYVGPLKLGRLLERHLRTEEAEGRLQGRGKPPRACGDGVKLWVRKNNTTSWGVGRLGKLNVSRRTCKNPSSVVGVSGTVSTRNSGRCD